MSIDRVPVVIKGFALIKYPDRKGVRDSVGGLPRDAEAEVGATTPYLRGARMSEHSDELDGPAATPSNALPAAVLADLRTDHAGEVGAAQIYRGILAVAREGELRAFAARHLATELLHLRRIRQWLPASAHSRLLPLWRLAGWLTGAMPALIGPRAVFVTVAVVERFVDRHYAAQIERLSAHPELADLRETLAACRRDEIAHRDDSLARLHGRPGAFARAWSALIGTGSELAVAASRRL